MPVCKALMLSNNPLTVNLHLAIASLPSYILPYIIHMETKSFYFKVRYNIKHQKHLSNKRIFFSSSKMKKTDPRINYTVDQIFSFQGFRIQSYNEVDKQLVSLLVAIGHCIFGPTGRPDSAGWSIGMLSHQPFHSSTKYWGVVLRCELLLKIS